MSEVVKLNNLVQKPNQTFGFTDRDAADFNYSDGEQVETYLHQVFSEATDLSSRSSQLQAKIKDWPSEYHLSSDRSNLLRGYDLSFVNRALEFGSGCGAISRYLGEQGIAVDAIEGSGIRAELGKMRCKDLDNVSVINANYNDLEFPIGHYDLILFVGVIEYAKKFHPQSPNDRHAALTILQQAKNSLSKNGVILVAIENRLGLKYILGHHEDHYSKRYVGIDQYRDSAGIATYSEAEWREIIDEAGFSSSAFSFPFPDYKIPRICLGEEFVKNDDRGFNHLEGVFARDYTMPATRSPTEPIAWQAASSGKFMHTIANSFCLIMGDDSATVDQAMCFDFCHMPGPGRKNRYAVVTRKLKHNEEVQKIPVDLVDPGEFPDDDQLKQVLETQAYLTGDLLSTRWLRAILIFSRREEFDALLADYYAYLTELENSAESLKIDLLPINIIVGEDGSYHSFDQEWEVGWKITKEYLLFRALLTFVVTNWIHMKEFLGWLEIHSVKEFVDYGFRNHKLMLAQYLDDFVAMENKFQDKIANLSDDKKVGYLLDTVFDFTSEERDLYGVLHWKVDEDELVRSDAVEVSYYPDPEPQSLEFELPETVDAIDAIRLDPFDIRKTDKIGFFKVSNVELVQRQETQDKLLWQISGEKKIAELSNATSAVFEPLAESGYWLSSTEFPKLEFQLEQRFEKSKGSIFLVRVQLSVVENLEYILAHRRYLIETRQAQQTAKDLKTTLHHLDSARKEIADIKAGRPFRLGMKIFSMLQVFKPSGK